MNPRNMMFSLWYKWVRIIAQTYLYKKNSDGANEVINTLSLKYAAVIDELYRTL